MLFLLLWSLANYHVRRSLPTLYVDFCICPCINDSHRNHYYCYWHTSHLVAVLYETLHALCHLVQYFQRAAQKSLVADACAAAKAADILSGMFGGDRGLAKRDEARCPEVVCGRDFDCGCVTSNDCRFCDTDLVGEYDDQIESLRCVEGHKSWVILDEAASKWDRMDLRVQ